MQKLGAIASDLQISGELRAGAVVQLGSIGTQVVMVALLDMVANEALALGEGMLALKQVEKILKLGRHARWRSLKPRGRN